LAELYWSHQRDEGEPVFNQFLGQLDEELTQLAVQAMHEADQFGDLEQTLNGALQQLAYERESLKHKTELERTTDPIEKLGVS